MLGAMTSRQQHRVRRKGEDHRLHLRCQCTAYKSELVCSRQERRWQEVNVLSPKSTPTSRQQSIIQHLKEMSHQATKGHGSTFNAYDYMEDANLKSLQTVWFHLPDALEKRRRQNYGDSKKMNRTGKDESTSKEDF